MGLFSNPKITAEQYVVCVINDINNFMNIGVSPHERLLADFITSLNNAKEKLATSHEVTLLLIVLAQYFAIEREYLVFKHGAAIKAAILKSYSTRTRVSWPLIVDCIDTRISDYWGYLRKFFSLYVYQSKEQEGLEVAVLMGDVFCRRINERIGTNTYTFSGNDYSAELLHVYTCTLLGFINRGLKSARLYKNITL